MAKIKKVTGGQTARDLSRPRAPKGSTGNHHERTIGRRVPAGTPKRKYPMVRLNAAPKDVMGGNVSKGTQRAKMAFNRMKGRKKNTS